MILVINYKNEVLDKRGTGLIGSKLTSHLIDNGHSVNILSRRYRKSNNPRIEYFIWKPSIKVIDDISIKGVNVVINLVGSSVFSFWTKNNKKKILNSRIDSLSALYQIIKEKPQCISSNYICLCYRYLSK